MEAAQNDVQDLPALSTKREVAGPMFGNCSTRIGDDYFATAAVDLHSDQEAREALRRLAGILR